MFVDANAAADDGNQDSAMELDESKYPKFSEIDPAKATPEQIAELVKAGQTLLGQTKHWSKKAKELAAKPANEKIIKPNTITEPDVVKELQDNVQRLNVVEEKRQFGHTNNLSPEETDEVFAYSQGAGIKPKDALTKPFVKSALESIRSQRQADGATPGPSSRSPLVDGKPFNELKREDKIKNFEKLVQSKQRR